MKQVYFDPFGSRVEGYRQGLEDETRMQANTRAARAADWEHYNIAPLELSRLQRNERLADIGEPYAARQFALDEQQRLNTAVEGQLKNESELGSVTGDYSPLFTTLQGYAGGPENYVEMLGLRPALNTGNAALMQEGGYHGPPLWATTAYNMGISPERLQGFMARQTFTPSYDMARGMDQYYNYNRIRQNAADAAATQQQEWTRNVNAADAQLKAIQLENSKLWAELEQQRREQLLRGGFGTTGGVTATPSGYVYRARPAPAAAAASPQPSGYVTRPSRNAIAPTPGYGP